MDECIKFASSSVLVIANRDTEGCVWFVSPLLKSPGRTAHFTGTLAQLKTAVKRKYPDAVVSSHHVGGKSVRWSSMPGTEAA